MGLYPEVERTWPAPTWGIDRRGAQDLAATRALAPLPLGVVQLSGRGVGAWLNTLTSNDMNDLQPGDSREALILSPQGHVDLQLMVLQTADATLLLTEEPAATVDFLTRMRFASRVEIRDISGLVSVWGAAFNPRRLPAHLSSFLQPNVPSPATSPQSAGPEPGLSEGDKDAGGAARLGLSGVPCGSGKIGGTLGLTATPGTGGKRDSAPRQGLAGGVAGSGADGGGVEGSGADSRELARRALLAAHAALCAQITAASAVGAAGAGSGSAAGSAAGETVTAETGSESGNAPGEAANREAVEELPRGVWFDPWPGPAATGTYYTSPTLTEHPGENLSFAYLVLPAATEVVRAVLTAPGAAEAGDTGAHNLGTAETGAHELRTGETGAPAALEAASAGAGAAAAGGFSVAGAGAFEALRIAAWRPRLGAEGAPRLLPHEADWLRTAVHLHKGCYCGQETVAKIVNLGAPPRRLVMLDFDGMSEEVPPAGTPLFEVTADNVVPVGLVTAAAYHHEEGPIGLALVRRGLDPQAILALGPAPQPGTEPTLPAPADVDDDLRQYLREQAGRAAQTVIVDPSGLNPLRAERPRDLRRRH